MVLIIQALSILTVATQALIASGLVYLLLFPNDKKKSAVNFFGKNTIFLSFLVTLIATLGSLFFSEIAGFEPCRLCWFQRIFMYPQVILLAIGWIKKDYKIIGYLLILSLIGGMISLYHNYIYYWSQAAAFCSLTEQRPSCAEKNTLGFGYITIPLMALTAFVALIFLFLIKKNHDKSEQKNV